MHELIDSHPDSLLLRMALGFRSKLRAFADLFFLVDSRPHCSVLMNFWHLILVLGLGFSPLARGQHQSLMPGQNGFFTSPILTIGEAIGDYYPPGRLDGLAAFGEDDHVYVLANHELPINPATGGTLINAEYELKNGLSLSGGRISYFRIAKETRTITQAGLAFDEIINRSGKVVEEAADLVFKGLSRLCSGYGAEPGSHGFVDRIFFAGEETSSGTMFVLDVNARRLWAAPALGVGKWENVAPLEIPSLNQTHIVLLLGDDAAGAPLYLYIGEKDSSPEANFLARNGLAQGELYLWKANDLSVKPRDFTGSETQKAGQFIRILNVRPDLAGSDEFDDLGYARYPFLKKQQILYQAFQFSRPEDLATNPEKGNQVVFTSTGGSFDAADYWGTTYIIDLDLSLAQILQDDIQATIQILYDGDAYRENGRTYSHEGLRNPDNLCWSSDGYIYVQEDRANFTNRDAFGTECSIWRLDPTRKDKPIRIAAMDRDALPLGISDITGRLPGIWESSGIIDVSKHFDEAPGHLFLLNVQAHGTSGSILSSNLLAEAGQMLLLKKDDDPANLDQDFDGISELMEHALGTSDLNPHSGPNNLKIRRNLTGSLTVTLEHRPEVDHHSFVLEASSNLVDWQPADLLFEQVDTGILGRSQWIELQKNNAPLSEEKATYLRVRLLENP